MVWSTYIHTILLPPRDETPNEGQPVAIRWAGRVPGAWVWYRVCARASPAVEAESFATGRGALLGGLLARRQLSVLRQHLLRSERLTI
jgi:hypothetical protein